METSINSIKFDGQFAIVQLTVHRECVDRIVDTLQRASDFERFLSLGKQAKPPKMEKPKKAKTSRLTCGKCPKNVRFSKSTLRLLQKDASEKRLATGELALEIAYAQLQRLGNPPCVKTTRKFRKGKRVQLKLPCDERMVAIEDATKKAYPKQQIAPTVRRLVELHYEKKTPTTPNLF